jgi:hypothetical protein
MNMGAGLKIHVRLGLLHRRALPESWKNVPPRAFNCRI